VAVIAVGIAALLLLPDGRRALRDLRVWTAVAIGASAWVPLIAWNLDNADAGLRFQLVDRHPWSFHAEGAWFVVVQALMVTPLLFAALLHAGWRARRSPLQASRYFAWLGLLVVAGFFVLGFFADTERVSFHWPLPGYLALLPLLPGLLALWPRSARVATVALAAAGLLATLGYYAAVSVPELRARVAAEKWYPSNFAGWGVLADEVRAELARMPAGTRVVADNFKAAAELGFALGDPSIPVLDHPINHKHGRAPQLRLWDLQTPGREEWGTKPVLLVVSATAVPFKNLHARYRALCDMVGPLPPPRVLNVDHGRQRFLLFRLPAGGRDGPCTTPAMAWVDVPAAGARVGRAFEVRGWAFKDGVGLERVDVLLDGMPVGAATYGLPHEGPQRSWPDSTDPNHPAVGFRASVTVAASVPGGRHWLGLRLHGADGSVEVWPETPVVLAR
ncbi:MAG TPA: glycosyltransferase family 39 protein, partial [Lysobacter sp.]